MSDNSEPIIAEITDSAEGPDGVRLYSWRKMIKEGYGKFISAEPAETGQLNACNLSRLTTPESDPCPIGLIIHLRPASKKNLPWTWEFQYT